MKRQLLWLGIFVTISAIFAGVLSTTPASAAQIKNYDPFTTGPTNIAHCNPMSGKKSFFGFPPWYKYLDGEKVKANNDSKATVCRPFLNQASDIWFVVAALFEMLTYVSGMAAVGYVIWGAILYITSQGQPDKIANGKNTITNALVGLVIAILSARLIGFVAGRFSGSTNSSFLLPSVNASNGALSTILNLGFQLAGALAVLFLIWGGITYSRSNGDPAAMKEAKNTIIYSLIGLVVAVFAVTIVNYVVTKIT
jgi:ABC-type Fe3+ transport system permease subunit